MRAYCRSDKVHHPPTLYGLLMLKTIITNIFSIKGRLKRKGYLIGFLVLSFLWFVLSYSLVQWLPLELGQNYFYYKFALDVLALASFTPIMLKRAHDISLPSYVLIVYWLSIVFSVRNIIYLEQYHNTTINLNHWLYTVLVIVTILLTIILFSYRSYPKDNKWGKYIEA